MYVKCKGNFMEVKCFVICTDLLLPLKVNFSYFEIQIFMLLKLESESTMQKYAIESGIRIRRFFGRIAIPGNECTNSASLIHKLFNNSSKSKYNFL